MYSCYPALQITADSSHMEDSVCCGEIQVNKIDTSESTMSDKPPVWPTVRLVLINRFFILANICIDGMTYLFLPCDLKEKTPRRTVISRGRLTWSTEDMDSLNEDLDQASTPKKRRLSRMNSQEEMTAQIKSDNREGREKKILICTSHSRTGVGGEVLMDYVISFSVSIEALEPHDVFE